MRSMVPKDSGDVKNRREINRNRSLDSDLLDRLAGAPVALIATGATGRTIVWNRVAEALLGYEADYALGLSSERFSAGDLWTAVSDAWCPRRCGLLDRALAGELVPPHTTAMLRSDGSRVWVNVAHLVARPDSGEDPVTINLLWDLSTGLDHLHALVHQIQEIRELFPPGIAKEPVDLDERLELTPRQQEVLALLARGMTTAEIAHQLSVSQTTVRNHIQNLLARMRVHSRLEAVAKAHQIGLY